MDTRLETRVCAACGREFGWRRKWKQCWSQVRYCSARCRRDRVRPVDRRLEEAIRELLRGRTGTICPSEAARRIGARDWRGLMQPARAAGRRLAEREEIVVLQRGRRVEPSAAVGPIRFGRGRRFPLG